MPLPLIESHVDYTKRSLELQTMDEFLQSTGVEEAFLSQAVVRACAQATAAGNSVTDIKVSSIHRHAQVSLRCNIARILSGESFRDFSIHLVDSHLLQWFCHVNFFGGNKTPAKSTLQRMSEEVSEDDIRAIVTTLVQAAAQTEADGTSSIGLCEPLSLDAAFIDTTCLKLNIHFPVDWILLRDAIKSMIACIQVIRGHGLYRRMKKPESFVREINELCMQMTASGRQSGSKKKRKALLRSMKSLTKTVQGHGERYLSLLEERWADTELTQGQMQQIAQRLRHIVEQVPAAITQAHERIIGERPVANEDKILSLYEDHASVYVRGKAGATVEFGIQMLLVESMEGLIIDWDIPSDGIVSDSKALMPCIDRLDQAYGSDTIEVIITDRGFTSAANDKELEKRNKKNYTMPKNPEELKQATRKPGFKKYHTRRAQTEARIGIFKHNFAGEKITAKGLDNQKKHIAWSVLAHNIWVLARRAIEQRQQRDVEAA